MRVPLHVFILLLAFVPVAPSGGLFRAAVAQTAQSGVAQPKLTARQRELVAQMQRVGKDGQAFLKAGNIAEAVQKFEDFVSLQRELLGRTHDRVIDTLNVIAKLQLRLKDFDAATETKSEVLAAITERFEKGHWRVTDARLGVEDIRLQARLTPEQRRKLSAATQDSRRIITLFRQVKYDEAIALARQTLETHKTLLGETHPHCATLLNNLGELHREKGDYAAAEPLYQQALELRKTTLGTNHPRYATSLNTLGTLYSVRKA